MSLTTEAVPIVREAVPPIRIVSWSDVARSLAEKLDGPLTKLLEERTTPGDQELALIIRCEAQNIPAARDLIQKHLSGSIVREVPWVDRGSLVHAILRFDDIPALASDPNVFTVGLLQTFVTKR